MMNSHQGIHGVCKVRAIRYNPNNSNSVTILIETEGGQLEQSLYFGYTTQGAANARKLFFDMGGLPEGVIGSKAEDEAEIAKDTQS